MNLSNLENLRRDVHSLDHMLEEIENFQSETTNLIDNIQDIDQLLAVGGESETKETPLTQQALSKQKLYVYNKSAKEGEDQCCSVCLSGLQ